MEFLISRISNEGVLGMAFLAGEKCTLCLDKSALEWRKDASPLVDKGRK